MGLFDVVSDVADAVGGAVSDGVDAVGNAVSDGVDAAENAVSDGTDALGNAAADAANGVADVFDAGTSAVGDVWDLGNEAIDTAVNAVEHPFATADDLGGLISQGAADVGRFIGDHSQEILTGAEIAAGVALTPELGPVGAALLAAGVAAASDIASGKSAGDTLADALAAGADNFIPGSGHAAEALVNGIENGESIPQIAEQAGLGALAGSGDPA